MHEILVDEKGYKGNYMLYNASNKITNINEATKDLTSSLKGFKLEATEAMDVVDKLTYYNVIVDRIRKNRSLWGIAFSWHFASLLT